MCQYVKCFAKGVGVNRTIRNSFLMEVHFRRRKIRCTIVCLIVVSAVEGVQQERDRWGREGGRQGQGAVCECV